MSKEIKAILKETLSVIVIAFVLAITLRNYVFERREIPTLSMVQTVQVNDRAIFSWFIF